VPDSFRYFRCRACLLLFHDQIPADLRPFYTKEQYGIPASDQVAFQPRADSQRWKVDILKTLGSPGPLFEVGPATGEFAVAAQQAGFQPTLAEMDPSCCTFLRETLKLNVVQTADPAAVLATARPFSFICIWQAIEHIPRFWELLDRAAENIVCGGVIVISTPNPCSLQARILGRFWPHLDTPRHLHLIPQSWFHQFARKHNLSVTLDTTRDVGSLGLNYYGWYLAVRNALRPRMTDERYHGWAKIITDFLRQWEEAEGQGCCYTLALRKES